MKILVPIKRVLDYAAKIKPKADGSGIEEANIKWIVNPFDEIAVEEAIRLREKGAATEVVVISIGIADVQTQIRYCLAMGADRGIHISTTQSLDSDLSARVLAKVFQTEEFGLIIMGKQGIDTDASQTGSILSSILDIPQACFASKVEISGNVATVTREVDGGLETLEFDLPGIITSDLRLNEPRYASLPGIMQAKKKPLNEIAIDTLGIELNSKISNKKFIAPEPRKAGKKVASLDELVQSLKDSRVL